MLEAVQEEPGWISDGIGMDQRDCGHGVPNWVCGQRRRGLGGMSHRGMVFDQHVMGRQDIHSGAVLWC